MAAKDEQKDQQVKKEGGGSKKKWVFIGGGALITLIAIGVAVFFFLRGSGETEDGADEGEKTTKASSEKAGQHNAIYSMEPFIVNIHDGPELRYLKVKMEFEIKSAETKAELDPLLPPMQDAILVLLSGKQLADISTTEGKNKLKDEVMAGVSKLVPPGRILKVYFTDFVVQ